MLSWPVSGDVAIRSGWADGIDHVAAFGGLHPQYPRPSNLPDLRPLSINFGTNNPRITLTAYAAMTLNSLQFGAHDDCNASGPKSGSWAGWRRKDTSLDADLLHPFAFDVAGGGLSLRWTANVVLGLGFNLRLTGPNTFHITAASGRRLQKSVGFGISSAGGRRVAASATADGAAGCASAASAGPETRPVRAHCGCPSPGRRVAPA